MVERLFIVLAPAVENLFIPGACGAIGLDYCRLPSGDVSSGDYCTSSNILTYLLSVAVASKLVMSKREFFLNTESNGFLKKSGSLLQYSRLLFLSCKSAHIPSRFEHQDQLVCCYTTSSVREYVFFVFFRFQKSMTFYIFLK